jgi:hypothetical protein
MSSETLAPSPINCKLGSGALFFDRHDASGNKTGLFHFGNGKDLRASASQSRVTLPNYITPDGGTYAEGSISQEISISFLGYEFSKKNIALWTSGTEAFYTQTATTVTAESLSTSLTLGAYYQTAYRAPGSLVVKQGTTTLVSGTDYSLIDATAGLIKILTTGAATAGSAVTADYVGAAVSTTSQPIVQMYNAPNIFGTLLYLSADRQGPAWEMKWWRVSVQQGDLEGLIGDDWGSSTVNFKVLNDAAGTYGGSTSSPYGTAFRR